MHHLCAVATLGSVASYTCHLCAVATLGSVASYTCHLCAVATLGKAMGRRACSGMASPPTRATYALLRRWERLRVGERSSGMASPPTSTFHTFYGRDTSRPYINLQPSPNTHHPTPITQHPTPITHHPSPITQHPTPNTQQKKWALPVVDGSAFHYACCYEKK